MRFLMFNGRQIDRLSEILGNLGLVLLASMVLPVFTGYSGISLMVMLSGAVLTFVCLLASIIMAGGDGSE